MVSPANIGSAALPRTFAARYRHPRLLWITGALTGVASAASVLLIRAAAVAENGLDVPMLVMGIALALAAVFGGAAWTYLIRGKAESPAARARREAREQHEAEAAARRAQDAYDGMERVAGTLAEASGAAAFVQYRNLKATADHWYGPDADMRLTEWVERVGFDPSTVRSERLGFLHAVDGGAPVEIFRDWVIRDQEAYNVDVTTSGHVHVDGAVQVSTAVDANGRLVEHRVDSRRAELQLLGAGWSVSAAISPDDVIEARKLLARLDSHVGTLKPRAASSDDISQMVERILNGTGQPPAEKLQQLSNLRFERLLSDEDFERAKAKILGLS